MPFFGTAELTISSWELNVNAHYLFPLGERGFVWYPIVGLCIVGIRERASIAGFSVEESRNVIGFNFGAGMDFPISERLIFNAELALKLLDGGVLSTIQLRLAFRL
ncbi:MAG: porin family protein [Bacteroidales bacterium]|nr:porin family protein [Bacteroidales bacterium]